MNWLKLFVLLLDIARTLIRWIEQKEQRDAGKREVLNEIRVKVEAARNAAARLDHSPDSVLKDPDNLAGQ